MPRPSHRKKEMLQHARRRRSNVLKRNERSERRRGGDERRRMAKYPLSFHSTAKARLLAMDLHLNLRRPALPMVHHKKLLSSHYQMLENKIGQQLIQQGYIGDVAS